MKSSKKQQVIDAIIDNLQSYSPLTQKELAVTVDVSDRTIRNYLKDFDKDIIKEIRKSNERSIARLGHFYIGHLIWKTMNHQELTSIEHKILFATLNLKDNVDEPSRAEELAKIEKMTDEELEMNLQKRFAHFRSL